MGIIKNLYIEQPHKSNIKYNEIIQKKNKSKTRHDQSVLSSPHVWPKLQNE